MLIITKKDLEPNIKEYLEAIEDHFLFHKDYELKHPLAIHNTSFSKVENSLKDFFIVYKSIKIKDFLPENKKDDKITETLKQYRSFLYSLREYLDDCFHIVKTFISPKPGFKDNRNQYSWLKQNIALPCVITFLSEINSYKVFLDRIVNELKHNNAILNGIIIFDKITNDFSLGYYVANVFNQRFEPVAGIHLKFKGQDTAFSFARDIRYNICNIFYLSEKLIEVISCLNPQISISTQERVVNQKRLLLYKDISDLPRCFFPDEYQKDVPSVALKKDEMLKLEIPSKFSLKPLYHREMLLFHSGDGKTKKFALLYYSRE
ncbi:MAG: hypothetical protein HQ537_01775 [Parcubacteria group bacterium]|nr:hypothetical protein [Parcubacteria group bacterium]